MIDFPKEYKELVNDVCTLYMHGSTKLMCDHTRNEEPALALKAIALHEQYYEVYKVKITSQCELIEFFAKASADYLKYFTSEKLGDAAILVYEKMHLKILAAQLALALKDNIQTEQSEAITEKSPVLLISNEKTNRNISKYSKEPKRKHSKNISENYKFGAQIANDWLQIQITNLDSWENIRQAIPKESLSKVLKKQSKQNDFLRGGMDKYDAMMTEIAPEFQTNNLRTSR